MIHILPTYQILSAVGIYYIYKYFDFKKSVILIPPVIAFFLFYYLSVITDFPLMGIEIQEN